MNPPSSPVPESPLDSRGVAPAPLSAIRPLYWSVRRELWENRSIYIAPLAAAAVILFGFLISTFGLPHTMRTLAALDQAQQRAEISKPYTFAALLIMGATFLVGVFYCLDALHGERRDRSILFWKSLPVSDLTTVLSKASIPLVILPLLTFVITIATQWSMLVFSSGVLLASGISVTELWSRLPFFQMSLMLLYHLVAIHALWYAPIYCWMLLVSGWARRAAFLWAFLPLFVIVGVEKLAFNTSYFAALLRSRASGGPEDAGFPAGSMATDHPMHVDPARFLISPGLWIGLAFAVVFLAAAVRLRRNREPI